MISNRIKYALYLDDWEYETGSKKELREKATKVLPSEYTDIMRGKLFCPECCVGLFRTPKHRLHDRRGRRAFYAHVRSPAPFCSLRVSRSVGKMYLNEEQAKQAIENEELLVVKEFMKNEPEVAKLNQHSTYSNEPIEDISGDITEVAIGRHTGEKFKLSSNRTTVRSLCLNFDSNWYKYIILPNQNSARLLRDQIINIKTVDNTNNVPRLYFGKIICAYSFKDRPQNIRMIKVNYAHSNFKDFYIKVANSLSDEHGIYSETENRIVLAYGKVTNSGLGLCIEHLGWGEMALLPTKYEYLLDELDL